MNIDKVLLTKIVKGKKPIFTEKRIKRISEAINFESGTIIQPCKLIISTLPNNKDIYFLKPGKETIRKNPNIFDMTPCVGFERKNEVAGYTFELIWEYLVKISIINQLTFKKILLVIYRIGFLLDHIEIQPNKIRYKPNNELIDYINKLDFSLKDGFIDKFKKEEIGLLEYLHFIDLLAWNEDVKYNVKNGEPFFEKGKKNTGRINTILSIISVPLMINDFVSNIIENVNYIERINVRLILSTMQKLSKSRGVHTLSQNELIKYLSPYLTV